MTSSRDVLSDKMAKAESELRSKDELEARLAVADARLAVAEQSLREKQKQEESGRSPIEGADGRITSLQVALMEEIERRAQLQRAYDSLEITKCVFEEEL